MQPLLYEYHKIETPLTKNNFYKVTTAFYVSNVVDARPVTTPPRRWVAELRLHRSRSLQTSTTPATRALYAAAAALSRARPIIQSLAITGN